MYHTLTNTHTFIYIPLPIINSQQPAYHLKAPPFLGVLHLYNIHSMFTLYIPIHTIFTQCTVHSNQRSYTQIYTHIHPHTIQIKLYAHISIYIRYTLYIVQCIKRYKSTYKNILIYQTYR